MLVGMHQTRLPACFDPLRTRTLRSAHAFTTSRPYTLPISLRVAQVAFAQPSLRLPHPQQTLLNRSRNTRACRAKAAYAEGSVDEGDWLRNDDLELHKVPGKVRDSVQNAIEALGQKGTVGDVAARAGVGLKEAERALQALAADAHGTLQVSDDGDILYVFPRNFRSKLLRRSAWLRMQPALKAAQRFTAYMSRIIFGTTLVASVLIVWVTLLALMTASSSSDRDRNRSGNDAMFYYSMRNMGDLFWYWDPYYVRHPHASQRGGRRVQGEQQSEGMGFLEGIFSFVFGDGDPNADIAEKRWQLVGQYIQSRGGVVAAEEVAPYLGLDGDEFPDSELYGDESYMMPVLLRFGGVPVSDDNGHVLYKFPSLQITGRQVAPPTPADRALLEQPWKQTNADGLQVAASVGLGVVNFVGLAALGQVLQNPAARMALAGSALGWVGGVLPFLSVYAVAFFAIPAIRALQNAGRNAAINKRNEARKGFLRQLAQPSRPLQQKMTAARRLGNVSKIDDRNTVFRTDRSVEEQAGRSELEDFDRKLGQGRNRSQAPRQGDTAASRQLESGRLGGDDVPVQRDEESSDWRKQVFRRRQAQQDRRDWG